MNDLFLGFAAHTQELLDSIPYLLAGETYDYPFELTSWDKNFLEQEIYKLTGAFPNISID